MPIKQWKARAIGGAKEKRVLVLARMIGESVIINLNGEILEVTVAKIAANSVALMFETAEKNLIMRKELTTDSTPDKQGE
jgi:sRNA-binding carbon storage regulator CsrA